MANAFTPGTGLSGAILPGFNLPVVSPPPPGPTPGPNPNPSSPAFISGLPGLVPQQFTNVNTLINGQVKAARIMIFLNSRPLGRPALPNTGLPGRVLPGFARPRYGYLLNEGSDYAIKGGLLTLVVPPPQGTTLTAVVFQIGIALGGPTPTRYVAPWQLPLAISGLYDGVSTAYQIQFPPTIFGACDGINNLFTWGVSLKQARVFRNGLYQTKNVDFAAGALALVFLPGAIPQPGDIITMSGWA